MDRLRHEEEQKHIMVMKAGQVFVMDVYHENGDMYTPAEVELQLRRIEEMCKSARAVGVYRRA